MEGICEQMVKMNRQNSKSVFRHLKKIFGRKFEITKEKYFPFDETTYKPDLIFQDKEDGSIKAIIEIENCSRKHMVGGVITADYCMGKRKQHPDMFIIALDEQNKKDYRKRLPMFKKYKKHLKNITIDNKLEITKKLREL